MFTGLNAIDFAKAFPDNEACYKYLDQNKWKNGYRCRKCGGNHYVKGRTGFHRRCRQCHYDESLTANTLFHDMRMPVKKAFFMIFRIAGKIKGMSTAELAREVGVQQKTAWLLKRKIQEAMSGPKQNFLFAQLPVTKTNESDTGQKEMETSKKQTLKKSFSGSLLYKYMATKTDKLTSPMVKESNTQRKPIPFLNVLDSHPPNWTYPGTLNQQLLFRSWLRGIHHKCAEALFSKYCAEFAYRFNRRKQRGNILGLLIKDMLQCKPHPYAVLAIA